MRRTFLVNLSICFVHSKISEGDNLVTVVTAGITPPTSISTHMKHTLNKCYYKKVLWGHLMSMDRNLLKHLVETITENLSCFEGKCWSSLVASW